MSRRLSKPQGWLRPIVLSGRYLELALQCNTDLDLAELLGVTKDSLFHARKVLRSEGLSVPGVQELRYSRGTPTESEPDRKGRVAGASPAPSTHVHETFLAHETHDVNNAGQTTDEWDEVTQPGVAWNEHVAHAGQHESIEGVRRGSIAAVPDGHFIKGVSSYVVDGEVRGQWIKTSLNDNDLEAVTDAVRRLGDEWPEYEPVPVPEYGDDDLLCVYPMGDPHLGMLSWSPETGEDFDLAIAERYLFAAVDHLVDLAPPSKRALVCTVGDTLHSDGYGNATTKGTRVDVDSRTPKMVTTALRTFRRVIYRALQKHEEVEVKIVPGNHDALMTLVLSIGLQQFFEHEPRVHIDPSPQTYQWYRFGANLIGVTHGDKANATGMMGVMAVDRAKDWGETTHRRIYAGHIHHEVVKEVPGVIVEHLRTLASKDAWHAGMGYRSGRDMKLDVFHREDGHINRHIVGIQAVKRRAA